MKKKDFPILYYQLDKQSALGILLGSYEQVIERDIRSVQLVLKSKLQRDYKRHGYYPDIEIEDTKLRIINIPLRPTYRSDNASYPLSHKVSVPIPVITGSLEEGGYDCYLPLFQRQFSYNHERQFNTLVKHFISNYFTNLNPEDIYTFLRYPKPQLAFVSLRIKKEQEFKWNNWTTQRNLRTLNRLAVQVPQKKAGHSKSTLPKIAWERDRAIQSLIETILLANGNVLVVGEKGAGKSMVIQQAIKEITNQMKGQQMTPTFWQIMPQRITASSKYLGEWQEAVENLIDELTAINGVLWVDQIIQLLMSGGEGAEDSIAAFMIPFLQQQKIKLLGEVTPQELESMRRLLPGFVEHFQLIELDKLSEKQVHYILSQLAEYSHNRLKINVEGAALIQIYRLLLRYYPYEAFPGKGAKFLANCINVAKLQKQNTIGVKEVIDQFVKESGMPEIFLRDELSLKKADVKAYFSKRIMGQATVIQRFLELIQVYKAGLNDPNKPIATMLFAGPTGVGKTASAKALANYFFGKGQENLPLIRIDMSEYQHPNQYIRFIGYGKQVGKLVKEVREKPFAVVLLDEVEKAHPSIFDALLGLLDEGILTDHFGRQTNFRNTIIIMTSNLGASNQKPVTFASTDSTDVIYHSAIRHFFRPEFINRIDNIVFFNALNQGDIEKILLKELEELKTREGYQKQGLQLKFSKQLIQHLAKVGFNEKYGARPLQKAIEREITTPMSKWILEHNTSKNQILQLDYDNKLTITII